MIELTHLSLFSGIGGIDLAAEWAGFKTVAFVERDKFCQKVLAKNFPGVPIHDDIKEFGAKDVAYANDAGRRKQRVSVSDGAQLDTTECSSEIIRHAIGGRCSGQPRRRTGAKSKDGHPRMEARVHLLSGGFPCQPFSVAGKRKGTSDERFLWDEMLRVIREVQPLWVLGENVRGLLSIDGGRTFGTIIHELAQVGYRVGWGVYGACHVAAPHRRERVFIIANAYGDRGPQLQNAWWSRGDIRGLNRKTETSNQKRDGLNGIREDGVHGSLARRICTGWATEPNVGRVAHGVPNRVDRLRALGNAVVPQQVFPILNAIAEQIREAA